MLVIWSVHGEVDNKMTEEQIIEKLRIIFDDIIIVEEDFEFTPVEDLTGKPIDFITYRNVSDETFLHTAAIRGYLEGTKLLVELGIDINILGDMGYTALHYAARFENDDIYNYLISQGADEKLVNEFGETPAQSRK